MDGVTLDRLIAEIAPTIVGRHLGRPRIVGPHAVVFEISGDREHRLWLEASRAAPGIYRLSREGARALGGDHGEGPAGRTRQALLLLRKHLDGARVHSLRRIPGERTIVLESGGGVLALRLSGPAPALTLAIETTALATIGEGPLAWPLPPPAPEREWDTVEPGVVAAAAAAAGASGQTLARAILRVCPALGPLARQLDGSTESLSALRARLASPRPTLLAPGPPGAWHDRELAAADAVTLVSIPLEVTGRVALHPPSWQEAAALFLEARLRGARFERAQRSALAEVRRKIRRLTQLETHLEGDLAGMPDTARLRHEAEALLALAEPLPRGAEIVEIADPYQPGTRLRIAADPGFSAPAIADRRFEKARRIDRARRQVELRLREARAALEAERAREGRILEAKAREELGEHAPDRSDEAARSASARHDADRGRPSHFLTSRGLSLLVGRGAKENHHLTFTVARPEDLWFHARDVAGAHVILRDNEGRTGADDLREAAEVAAFFSEARGEARVDVHVTRRKHLRPARGGPGRVVIAHSETLRVTPRDPEGRLRRR